MDEIDDPATTMETLSRSRGMDTIDVRLLAEVVRITAGTLVGGGILRARTRAKDAHRHLKGRQPLLIVYNYYRTEETNMQHLSFLDIMSVLYRGDDRLQQFMENWDNVLVRIHDDVPEHQLEQIFYAQVKQSKVLSIDIGMYDRAARGTPERSYRLLYNSVRRHLDRLRQQRNRQSIVNAMAKNGREPAMAAEPVTGASGSEFAAPAPAAGNRSRPRTPSRDRGRPATRSKSPGDKSRKKSGSGTPRSGGKCGGKRGKSPPRSKSPSQAPCMFYEKGACRNGA